MKQKSLRISALSACNYILDIRTKEHKASRPLRLCVKNKNMFLCSSVKKICAFCVKQKSLRDFRVTKICSYVLLSKKSVRSV